MCSTTLLQYFSFNTEAFEPYKVKGEIICFFKNSVVFLVSHTTLKVMSLGLSGTCFSLLSHRDGLRFSAVNTGHLGVFKIRHYGHNS